MSYVNGRNGKRGGKLPLIPTREELEKAGIKIALAIPLERYVPDSAFLHFYAIAMKGWPLFARPYGRTDFNRNEFARTLLDSDYTHLMMLDLDHLHSPTVIEQHARWLLDDPDKLVIGGIHFRRGEPFDPCIFLKSEDGKLYAPVDWSEGLIKVDAIGHGTILISRKVFEQIQPPWWCYTYNNVGSWIFPSEDLYFCHLLNHHHIDIWCDTTITSPHLIQSSVDENAFRLYLQEHPELIAEAQYDGRDVVNRKKIKKIKPEKVAA